jgi:hypothetical protein
VRFVVDEVAPGQVFFPEYCGFSLSALFQSMLIFLYMLLLPQGKTGPSLGIFENAMLFQNSGSTG